MEGIVFDGQQQGEQVLTSIYVHESARIIGHARIIFLTFFFIVISQIIGTVVPAAGLLIKIGGVGLGLAVLVGGILWLKQVYAHTITYITDRRIIRFEVMTPFFTTKRALFWNEALKAKGYAPNLFYRLLKIGNLRVEPHMAEHEDVLVTDIGYYDDLANYIDKILFTFKNKPEEIGSIKLFIPKPRGQRGA